MVILESEIIGLSKASRAASNLRSIERKINTNVRKAVTKIPSTRFLALASLYSKSPTKLSNIKAEVEASGSDITEEVIVFNEGTTKGRQLGSVRTSGASVDNIIRKFRESNNTIFISIPSISKNKIIAINPKKGDLVVNKDGRGKNLYNIGLSGKAVRRLTKEFSENVRKIVLKEAQKDFFTEKRSSGLSIDIAGKLGVAADKIHIIPSISGADLTVKTRKQVTKNMVKVRTGMTYERSIAMKQLINRTGGFVRSIANVRVKDNTSIGYTLNNESIYGIHEKPAGTITTIVPRSGKVLAFTNKKTGEKVFTRKVRVRARPVIKKSIRAVAMKLFGRRFNIEKD